MPGILELQFIPGTSTDRDKKIAHLIYAYKQKWDELVGIPEQTFARSRVLLPWKAPLNQAVPFTPMTR